ncbi:hypothetical protein PHLCEN_2v13437 [Hermanssonia centrifuga]|uniref:HAUS augmin-like complex subunit 6 N-terminal domain-containing protein n=1 Tax=Hermanssonia centrifuga TaxID=98765 RepID=A0A2R6NE99_9APHY|nr:hypothetical protein PHLCEN_2v13437 [Hermanssonia centrifuga]
MSFTDLPTPLLLLIHLHLLGFPSKKGTKYDEHLFNPNEHGIGERTKTLEEIAHFLVSKIKRNSGQIVKKILPTYPCTQPADTLAFRTALTKYLESLKHDALHSKSANKDSEESAWWWKDIIIRKSLLEECAGDRFTRLLLALSTHALWSYTSTDATAQLQEDISKYANEYVIALSTFQSARISWEISASRLNQRQNNLDLLNLRLADPTQKIQSKYDTISTERLLALRDSKIQDLLKAFWRGEEGKRSLYALFEIIGLVPVNTHDGNHNTVYSAEVRSVNTAAVAIIPPSPLPIAAAHHPKQLHNLAKSVLPISPHPSQSPVDSSEHNQPIPKVVMPECLAEETQNQQRLHHALLRSKRLRDELLERLMTLKTSNLNSTTVQARDSAAPLKLNLWMGASSTSLRLNFHTASTISLLTQYGLPPLPTNVQSRVDTIRASLKATWPAIFKPTATNIVPHSKIPQYSNHAGSSTNHSTQRTIPTQSKSTKETKVLGAPKGSSFLARGRARRSSAFALPIPSESDEEIDNIVNTILTTSTSTSSDSDYISSRELPLRPLATNPPQETPRREGKGKVTQGTPVRQISRFARNVPVGVPGVGTPLSTARKPRRTFDMDGREREMMGVPGLPSSRKSLARALGDEGATSEDSEWEEGEEGEGGREESMTLGDYLVSADITHGGIKDEQLFSESECGA